MSGALQIRPKIKMSWESKQHGKRICVLEGGKLMLVDLETSIIVDAPKEAEWVAEEVLRLYEENKALLEENVSLTARIATLKKKPKK